MTLAPGLLAAAAGARFTRASSRAPRRGEALPPGLVGLTIKTSGWHQIAMTLVAVLVFILSTVPIELQRRIVNDAIRGGTPRVLFMLAGGYLAVSLGTGLLKLGLNVYRGWVSECATRWLRLWCLGAARDQPALGRDGDVEGLEISIIVAEAEPVGAFVGVSLSEPVLQSGLLLTIFGYLAYLQPLIAALSFAMLLPQFIVLPLLQQAINRRISLRIVELRSVSISILSHPDFDEGPMASIDRVLRINMRIYGLKFSMNFFMNGLHQLGVTAVLAIGGYFVLTGRTDVGTVVAFISGLAKVNDPWGDLVDWFRDFLAARAKYSLIERSGLALGAARAAD